MSPIEAVGHIQHPDSRPQTTTTATTTTSNESILSNKSDLAKKGNIKVQIRGPVNKVNISSSRIK